MNRTNYTGYCKNSRILSYVHLFIYLTTIYRYCITTLLKYKIILLQKEKVSWIICICNFSDTQIRWKIRKIILTKFMNFPFLLFFIVHCFLISLDVLYLCQSEVWASPLYVRPTHQYSRAVQTKPEKYFFSCSEVCSPVSSFVNWSSLFALNFSYSPTFSVHVRKVLKILNLIF